MRTFEEVWAELEAKGYQYGGGALENVRFGYELAMLEAKNNLKLETLLVALRALTDPEGRITGICAGPELDDLQRAFDDMVDPQ